jgi:rod shape-determining protein MreC
VSRSTYKKIFLTILFVITAILVINLTALNRTKQTPLEVAVKDTLAPIHQVVMNVSHKTRETFGFLGSLGTLGEENNKLKEEVRKLKNELAQVEEYKIENHQLRDMLDYRNFTAGDYQLMVASVVGRDSSNWFGTITINRGSTDGIQRDMAVVVPEGLVGRVVAVSKNTAEVLLITDPRSGVGAMEQQSRVPGIIEGIVSSAGSVRMVHLPKNKPVKEKQVIITSGIGGVYPSGIRIGKISTVKDDPGGMFKLATIDPFVDFTMLEHVFVVTQVYKPQINLSLEGDQ